MTQPTQKYTTIALLEPYEEGYQFSCSNWPLHVTIADTFAVDWTTEELIDQFDALSQRLSPAETDTTHEEFFGPDRQTRVTILTINKELRKLHYDVIGLLKTGGARFNDPQYMEEGYRPHVTVQSHALIKPGQKVRTDTLALIDMFPSGDYLQRKILKTIKL